MTTTTPFGHGLGRVPDLGDIRDFQAPLQRRVENIPEEIDLRPELPPIGDQGQLGSCTAWASLVAWRYERQRQGLPDLDGSELAQYYWTRALEHTTRYDSGASIRDAIKAMAKFGVAPESLWPYDIQQFTKSPTAAVKRAALRSQVLRYSSVPQDIDYLQSALASGHLVVFGISVYESFEGDHQGQIPMPDPSEKLLGGHAITLVGYRNASQQGLIRNHWQVTWGEEGYGWLPYEYILRSDLASDFWIVELVES